jgi:hypothetical protein
MVSSVAGTQPEVVRKLKLEMESFEQQLRAKSYNLKSSICAYINKLNESLNMISPIQAYVIDKVLVQWKREQQLVGNGYNHKTDIVSIQKWYP